VREDGDDDIFEEFFIEGGIIKFNNMKVIRGEKIRIVGIFGIEDGDIIKREEVIIKIGVIFRVDISRG
jgi:hypothetical protein